MIVSLDVHLQTVKLSIGVGRIFSFQRRQIFRVIAGLETGALQLVEALEHTHFDKLKRNLLINISLFMSLTTMALADESSNSIKLEYLL